MKMRINRVTTYNSKINFGYDKKFHQEMQKTLKQTSTERGLFLAKVDQKLIREENKILLLEKTGFQESQKHQELCNSLTRARIYHAAAVDNFILGYNCCGNLARTYRIEAARAQSANAQKWRRNLSEALNKQSIYQKEEIKKQFQKLTQEANAQASKEEVNTDTQSENSAITSIIPLYVPNEHSPKGLMDVIGSEDIKEKLKDDLIPYMVSHEQIDLDYDEYGIRAPRGFIFYGPPGCGKTFITQALANETGITMYTMDISKVGTMWINKTANNIRDAFEYIFEKAKKSDKPVILFMDEVDSLAISRSAGRSGSNEDAKSLTTLLKMVENARDNNVLVIAATNRYDILDTAFKDRFDSQIYFPMPDEKQIENLLTSSLLSRKKGYVLANNQDEIKELSKMLKGYSNRAIIQIIDDSAKYARKRSRDDISFDDVKKAIETTDHEKIKEADYKQEEKRAKIGF